MVESNPFLSGDPVDLAPYAGIIHVIPSHTRSHFWDLEFAAQFVGELVHFEGIERP